METGEVANEDQPVSGPVPGPAAPGSLEAFLPASVEHGWWLDADESPEADAADGSAWIEAADALELFYGWLEANVIDPWPHQEEALMGIAMGDHVVLGTPTGSGKSLVALGMHFIAMATGRRSYYTAPIKALVSEKFFMLADVLGRENVGMITGDVSINTAAPVICCTAEILANQSLRTWEDTDAGCVIMDEFHYYGDSDRGWAWQVPLLTLPKTQFLLMSATLGDVTAIADALQERTGILVDLVKDAARPVPLRYEYVLTPLETTVELAIRRGEAPLYIVHFAQDAALATAQSLASYGIATKEQRACVKNAMCGERFTTAFGKILQRLLTCGVGVHHAGMLPRYRLLVEKLAQKGALPVICGTDTLGVGINVPIHTVLFTALAKFDGHRMRRLRAREFHQIAGRAGRSGFDTEGVVIAEAPEHEIENAKALAKAGGDPKKERKVKKRQPPEGFVNWNGQHFNKLVSSLPETLVPHMRITNSMILSIVSRGGDARAATRALIDSSAQTPEQKDELYARADEILKTLMDAGIIICEQSSTLDMNDTLAGLPPEAPDTASNYRLTVELPDDFALDQPLSPFVLAALELFDKEDENYALDVISLVEASLDDPWQVLRAQEKRAKARAIAEMKADGIEYDERMEKLAEVTYPRPLEDLLDAAFDHYCETVPWARDFQLAPKSVLRDMVETLSNFKEYIGLYSIARSEGTLLRYLTDAYRMLARTIPPERYDERLEDIVAWLKTTVRTTDSSLMDEWEAGGADLDAALPAAADEVVADRRGLTVLVRNALFYRVRLAALGKADELGELDIEWGCGRRRWQQVLDEFFEAHDELRIDGDARSAAYLLIDEADERTAHVWHVEQTFCDPEGDRDFGIAADVDLDATQEAGEVTFTNYRIGSFEDLHMSV